MQADKKVVDKLFAIFILVISLAVVAVALPRFRASINQIPVDAAVKQLTKNKTLTDDNLEELIKITKESSAIWDYSKYQNDLRALLTHKAKLKGFFTQEGQLLLKRAQQATEKSLSQSPADAHLWFQLARLKIAQQSDAKEIVSNLRLSMLTGPNELHVIINRLKFSYFYFNHFESNEYDLLSSQTLTVWKVAKRQWSVVLRKQKPFLQISKLILQKQHPEVFEEMVSIVETTH